MDTITVMTPGGQKVEVQTQDVIAQLLFKIVIEGTDTPGHLKDEAYFLRELYDKAGEQPA